MVVYVVWMILRDVMARNQTYSRGLPGMPVDRHSLACDNVTVIHLHIRVHTHTQAHVDIWLSVLRTHEPSLGHGDPRGKSWRQYRIG
jgi:hypothetical protein